MAATRFSTLRDELRRRSTDQDGPQQTSPASANSTMPSMARRDRAPVQRCRRRRCSATCRPVPASPDQLLQRPEHPRRARVRQAGVSGRQARAVDGEGRSWHAPVGISTALIEAVDDLRTPGGSRSATSPPGDCGMIGPIRPYQHHAAASAEGQPACACHQDRKFQE